MEVVEDGVQVLTGDSVDGRSGLTRDASAAQREVVHTQHMRRLHGGFGQAADHPGQRHAAHRTPKPSGQASTRPAAQRQRDRLQGFTGPGTAAAVADRQTRNLLVCLAQASLPHRNR